MAYDDLLAERLRGLLQDDEALTEKRMFGGLAFLVNGNMAISASGQGGLLVRVAPEQSDALANEPHVQLFVMRGRPMQGWLRVAPEGIRRKSQLERWARLGVSYARSLPPKR